MGLLSSTLRSINRHKERMTSPPPAPGRRGDGRASERVDEPRPSAPAPAALPPALPRINTDRTLPHLGKEGRYVFDERVGIGLDLGMDLERAEDVALVEALLADGVIPHHLRPIASAVVDAWGPWDTAEVRVVSIEEWRSTGVSVGDILHAVTLAGMHCAASGLTTNCKKSGGGSGKHSKETSP